MLQLKTQPQNTSKLLQFFLFNAWQ